MADAIGWSEKYLGDYMCLNNGNLPGRIDREHVNRDLMTSWSSPDTDEYKTNCGVALDRRKRLVGLGIIVRNEAGEVMACCSQKLKAYISVETANAMAIHRGVQFGIDCGLNPSLVDSDETLVVKWINQGNFRDSKFGTILSDIDDLRTANSGVSFSYITSQANRAALNLAKFALRIAEGTFWIEDYPACNRSIVEDDRLG
ncbi:hypothetical protein LWI29_034474 [Acer saccharum]|uniref:RNase H type-1 domain-containing protein n=1 Tax=Acer saccharum TaxID=4024 RepID=A0AA39VUG0_ACESA|nr:hypothetical protein LWI29_034474 [Acer saccharum]